MKTSFTLIILVTLTSCSLINLFLPETENLDSKLKNLVFINEVSASHPTDEDWIEIYNDSNEAVDLWNFGLSDDPFEPFKWTFPVHSLIGPKSYMVIDFDGKNGNPDFGLSANADSVVITTPDGKAVIDSLATIPPSGSGSYGRSPDGSDNWLIFSTPTKGRAN